MTALSWILALIGAAVAWTMFLADAMSSGPRLDRITVSILALPLPLIATVLSSIKLFRTLELTAPSPWSVLAVGIPLLIALSTLLILIVAFFIRSG